MSFLQIKNWEKFQHYKDRSPPWIKLHRELLDDYEFSCLQDASKAHLMLLWLLASQLDNKIPADQKWLKNKLGLTHNIDLKELIDKGFLVRLHDASKPIADCPPETEGETEGEYISRSGKISWQDLTVDHIADWLAKKRSEGIYVDHDEHRVLEKFKNYCQAKAPKYKDYVAALRNSFEWKNAPRKNETTEKHNGKSKSQRANEAAARALEKLGVTDQPDGDSMLRQLEHLREGAGTA